jgi:hypothetical protein
LTWPTLNDAINDNKLFIDGLYKNEQNSADQLGPLIMVMQSSDIFNEKGYRLFWTSSPGVAVMQAAKDSPG